MNDLAHQALIKRRKKSAIVSRLMVTCFTEYDAGYGRKHVGAVAEELIVAWMLWQDDTPLKIADIAKALRIPRSNIKRSLIALGEAGLARKVAQGFVPDTSFIASRIDAQYFKNICDAVLLAADDLRRLD